MSRPERCIAVVSIHVQHKRLYAAIGETDNRHRKPAELGRLIERLMVLDARPGRPERLWLGHRDRQGVVLSTSCGRSAGTSPNFRSCLWCRTAKTVRYFPDKLPDWDSPPRRSGRLPLPRDTARALRLPDVPLAPCGVASGAAGWTLRLLAPSSLRKAFPLYLHAVREEFASPLHPAVVEELTWYFHVRKRIRRRRPDRLTRAFHLARRLPRAPFPRCFIGRGNSRATRSFGRRNRTCCGHWSAV